MDGASPPDTESAIELEIVSASMPKNAPDFTVIAQIFGSEIPSAGLLKPEDGIINFTASSTSM